MKINFSKLNLEELYKWKQDLENLAKNHSCADLRKKYQRLLSQIMGEICLRKSQKESMPKI